VKPRLSDLYGRRPHDTTLRNLAGLLDRALETSGRLRLFAVEAAQDGLQDCQRAYERMERIQREQIFELEQQLRLQLGIVLANAEGREHVPSDDGERDQGPGRD
jgi:hypothetical protein